MSTLIEELEQAAARALYMATQCTPQSVGADRWRVLREAHQAEAAALSSRIAHIRELERGITTQPAMKLYRALIGPIPEAGAAPEACETCGKPTTNRAESTDRARDGNPHCSVVCAAGTAPEAGKPGDEAECKICRRRFKHPAPGTGGTWTCSDACRMTAAAGSDGRIGTLVIERGDGSTSTTAIYRKGASGEDKLPIPSTEEPKPPQTTCSHGIRFNLRCYACEPG